VANLRTTADIVQDALFRSGENTDGSSDFQAAALEYAQRAYQDIYMGASQFAPGVREDWWWLRSPTPGVIILQPQRVMTITATFGLTAITFAAPPMDSLAGWWMAVSGFGESFRIQSHLASQAAATLDAPWTGDTGSTDVTLALLEYDLAHDVLRLTAPMWGRDRRRIDLVDPGVTRPRWPDWWGATNTPDSFAQVTDTRVRFNSVSGTAQRVEYDYLRRPDVLINSPDQEPLIPFEFRRLLADAATYFVMVDKNDNRADTAGLLVKNMLLAMQHEQRQRAVSQSRRFGQIQPRAPSAMQDLGVFQLGLPGSWW
jgi:hypothetical protein